MINLIDWRRGTGRKGGFDEFNSTCVASAIILRSHPLCNDSHQGMQSRRLGSSIFRLWKPGLHDTINIGISLEPERTRLEMVRRVQRSTINNLDPWGSKKLLYASKLKGKLLGVRAEATRSRNWLGGVVPLIRWRERLGIMNQRSRVWRPGLSPRVEMIGWRIARSKKSRIPSKLFKNI